MWLNSQELNATHPKPWGKCLKSGRRWAPSMLYTVNRYMTWILTRLPIFSLSLRFWVQFWHSFSPLFLFGFILGQTFFPGNQHKHPDYVPKWSIERVVKLGYRKSSMKPPRGLIYFNHIWGGLYRDGGLIWDVGAYLVKQRRWYPFSLKN